VFAVMATGLVAGVFLAFSDFVTKALVSVAPDVGIKTMQKINRMVYGSIFLVLFMGMAAYFVVLSGYAYFYLISPATSWIISGGLFYLVGVFLVTIVFNVPMNKRLDALDASSTDTIIYWEEYQPMWTLWNHVRAAASTLTMLCLLIASILIIA
jgi:uncharacterized membrane protein